MGFHGQNSPNRIISTPLRQSAAKGSRENPVLVAHPPLITSTKRRILCEHGAQGTPPMLGAHQCLKIRCRLVLGFALAGLPFHKKAVAQAPEHSHHPNAIGVADATSIIVVRDVQSLMRAAFNPPSPPVELEPPLRRQSLRLRAGHQRDQFVLAAFDLPQKQGALLDQRKANLFCAQRRGANRSTLRATLVDFLGAGLRGRGLQRGENRPRGP